MDSLAQRKNFGSRFVRDKNITFVFIEGAVAITDKSSIRTLIAARQRLGRSCLATPSINANGKPVFIKTVGIGSLPAKLRISLGLKRRIGAYDWPLAELKNNLEAIKRTSDIPRLTGYGFVRRFGLPTEMFLTFEDLSGYIHGLSWVRQRPAQALAFAQEALQLIHRLNCKGIYHLDLWSANIMLPPGVLSDLKAVDLENCYIGKTSYHSETLGFQFAFLYQFALRDFITEAEYDSLVTAYLTEHALEVDRTRFMPFFERFKHLAAGRKERHLIPTKGILIRGKPAKATVY